MSPRALVARIIVVAIFLTIVLRLGYLQLVDGRYGEMSDRNYLRNVVIHPPRGEIYDRNGELLAQNRLCYDVSIVRKDMPRGGFDTLRVCEILGLTHDQLVRSFKRSLPRREYRLMRYPITVEQKLLLDEMNISGFYTSQRTVRQYPRKIGGNLLGSIGEVSQKRIAEDPDYSVGDYIGMEGLELAYERELRGEKGLVVLQVVQSRFCYLLY